MSGRNYWVSGWRVGEGRREDGRRKDAACGGDEECGSAPLALESCRLRSSMPSRRGSFFAEPPKKRTKKCRLVLARSPRDHRLRI